MKIEASYIDYLHNEFRKSNIPEEEIKKLLSKLKMLRLARKEYLIKEGSETNKIAFVVSGLFRAFYLTQKGDEKTIVFRERGSILSSYSSYIKGEKSKFSIEALEDSMVLFIAIDDFEDLRSNNECWKIATGNYFMNLFIEKEARERELLSNSAKTNYLTFLKDYPGYIDRINHYHIASYLGISNVSLSRIRKEIAEGNT